MYSIQGSGLSKAEVIYRKSMLVVLAAVVVALNFFWQAPARWVGAAASSLVDSVVQAIGTGIVQAGEAGLVRVASVLVGGALVVLVGVLGSGYAVVKGKLAYVKARKALWAVGALAWLAFLAAAAMGSLSVATDAMEYGVMVAFVAFVVGFVYSMLMDSVTDRGEQVLASATVSACAYVCLRAWTCGYVELVAAAGLMTVCFGVAHLLFVVLQKADNLRAPVKSEML